MDREADDTERLLLSEQLKKQTVRVIVTVTAKAPPTSTSASALAIFPIMSLIIYLISYHIICKY